MLSEGLCEPVVPGSQERGRAARLHYLAVAVGRGRLRHGCACVGAARAWRGGPRDLRATSHLRFPSAAPAARLLAGAELLSARVQLRSPSLNPAQST